MTLSPVEAFLPGVKVSKPESEQHESVSGGRERQAQIDADEPRNLLTLAAFNVVLRFSWIFKTESVLIPRFLDLISGSGFVRGWLPILSRTAQSVVPLMLADRLRRQPLKKRSLLISSTLMGLCFLTLALVWFLLDEPVEGTVPWWMAPTFLAIYAAFFVVSGMNQLGLGTVQGKLIRPNRRGRLLAIAGITGSVVSITLAWFVLQRWLEPPMRLPTGGFVLIFGFAGIGFVLAGLLSLALREPRDDESSRPVRPVRQAFADAWDIFRQDVAFRRAAIVAMLFISVQLLFPHFQSLGRRNLGSDAEGHHLILWIIAQNAAVGIFSWMSGTIADRTGYRLAIRIQVFACCFTPLLALLLTSTLLEHGEQWFWAAFVFLGLVPVTMKSFINYALELTDPSNHPRYVSTMTLCFAVPFVLSPLVGWLIDLVGYEPIFVAISVAMGLGGVLTFRMSEPRMAESGERRAEG